MPKTNKKDIEYYLKEFKAHEEILPGETVTCHDVLKDALYLHDLEEMLDGLEEKEEQGKEALLRHGGLNSEAIGWNKCLDFINQWREKHG